MEKTNLHASVRLQDEPLTDFCLARLTDFVSAGMDKQMHTGMILVNLQKAFDTLDDGVLLEKM